MKFAKTIIILIGLIILHFNLIAEDNQTNEGNDAFYFDAIVLKSEFADSSRVDCYFMVPYQSLNFTKTEGQFTAKYQLIISVFDSLGNKISNRSLEKSLLESNFNVSQGGTGSFEASQIIIRLAAGSYKIKATLVDEFSRNEYSQSRTVSVIDYSKFPTSLSALMLVSTIEEINGKYKITPHLSDNISSLQDGFFAFFELYNQTEQTEVDILYQIFEGDKLIASGSKISKEIKSGTNRLFIRIDKPKTISNAGYILRVLAIKPSDNADYEVEDILAIAQRSIKSITKLGGIVLTDLAKSIRQLRYVATQQEIDDIKSPESDNEKIKKFEEFWKTIDPTPATERNEAFDEYYRRINAANKNFKSYTEGWLTDKGMVFIVFGPPTNIDRSSQYNDGRIYERWTYSNNREFLFADNTGFGDFRLVRPITVVEKFRYNQ